MRPPPPSRDGVEAAGTPPDAGTGPDGGGHVSGLLVGTGWGGLIRRRVRDSAEICAVRRDWPDLYTHEFVAPRLTEQDAAQAARAELAYWWRSPLRPRLSVVRISANDFRIHRHRRDCRAPDCPVSTRRPTPH
ncbi:hypothetical protein CS0771_60720 [Catellatospora sp. IY07-71]|nr:hypothetical protein CS0771_60720 [Catellatospora sp. IY07-71]